MGEWRTVDLAEVADDISYGYTESASDEPIGPKFLRITDIVGGTVNWATVPYCPINEKDLAKYRLIPGDIVIARTGATTGANYTVRETDPKDVVFASYLIRYRIDRSRALPEYVGYCLRSSLWSSFVEGVSGGSAQPGANAKVLGGFEFDLPDLPEQRAIASVLSSLDAKIDLLHRQNKTLEAMAETLFRQWFVEEAEEGWEEGTLGDIIEIHDSKRVPLSNLQRAAMQTGKLYPYYGAATIMDQVNDFLFDGEYILLGEDGTVVTEEGYPVLQYATGKFWVNNHAHVLQAKPPYTNRYLWTYLKKQNIADIVTGAVQPKISQGNLKALPIVLPPTEVVEQICAAIAPLYAKLDKNIEQTRSLTALRDTLLPKLMSGEVRVELKNFNSKTNG